MLRDLYIESFFLACKVWQRYFRYESEGFENVAGARSSLIVAYHGMPWPFDLFILGARIRSELGYIPHAIWLTTWNRIPWVKDMTDALGAFYGSPSDEEMARLKQRGEHLILVPGGSREALRSFRDRYTIDWGDRRGYLKLAHKHGLTITPVACTGTDVAYLGLWNGYRLSKRLLGHGRAPLWLALGALGPWPVGLPWPVKIRQRVGEPIDLAPIRAAAASEEEFLEVAHARVTGAMQGILDGLRGG